jgi:MtrB/PioB family decaheme-associated outer membrane protein
MRKSAEFTVLAALTLLISPYRILGQDKEPDHGTVDFGVRFATGDEYGRPDLPFQPPVKTSQFNEYQDVRNGFYVRHLDVKFDNVLHTKNYFALQSQSTLYHDQSYLASFGDYGKFKVQFRYDEIPHIYSNTTRTLYTQTSAGVFSYPALIRQALQAATPANTIPNIVNTQVVPQSNFFTPAIYRKAGTISASYNLNSRWNVNGMFFRESEKGNRPIGLIMNSSPSASTTSGFGVELPEPINYFNNLVRLGVDFGWRSLVVQGAYIGSFFQNNTSTLTWDNPFRLNAETITNPLTGAMALYPDNHANYFSFAAGTDLGKYLHVTASITPGFLKQSQAFLPYTTNTAITTCGDGTQACNSLAVLPAANLGGDAQTLAMNYTISTASWKNVTLKANYRQYDYNDNTPVHTFTPVQGDAAAPADGDNTPFGFNRKDLEVSGVWYFAKKSSIKAGYDALWMDRSHRDVSHSLDNTFFVSGDWVPIRDLLIRLSYRHSNRTPDAYQDDQVTDPTTGAEVVCNDNTNVSFTGDQRCHRRFDEAARTLNRGDFLVQYSPLDKLTVSAFGGTLQNDYNKRGGVNSLTPLNFLAGAAATVGPYYLYGLQKDISYNYGFDADYAFSSHVTLYAEYSREHYYQRMITRYRTPPGTGQNIVTCNGCDTANNDWQSTATDPVDVYSVGVDLYLSKKAYFTTYYTLSAGKGNVNSQFLGDPTIAPIPPATTNQNTFLLTGTNAATAYPETVDRSHEVGVIFKYKLTDRLTPRIEYRYQQWDSRDYQTTVMTPYMGCVSPPPPGAVVPNCTSPILNSATSPTPLPGAASPFYPGFVVGDPSAARYLFLGVDQPSYHAHTVMATLEYRF